MSDTYRCGSCGSQNTTIIIEIRGRCTEFGLSNVVLLKAKKIVCGECGDETQVMYRPGQLIDQLALAVAGKPQPLTAEEMKFLRKSVGLSIQRLSELTGIDTKSLEMYESDRNLLGNINDRLIRLVSISMNENTKDRVSDIVKKFIAIEDSTDKLFIEIDAETLEFQYVKSYLQ